MGPIAISFGLASAAVFVIAALFSTRHNRNVAGFLAFIWLITNLWDQPTGSYGQLLVDMLLGLLCGLLCIYAMSKERRSVWPVPILFLMAAWIVVNANYAGHRDAGAEVRYAHQLASNVLYGIALLVAAVPGGRYGAGILRRWLSPHLGVLSRLSHSYGATQGEKAEGLRGR